MAMGSPEREELGGALQVLTGSSPTRGSRRQRAALDGLEAHVPGGAFLSGGLRSAGNAHANGLSPRGAAYTVGARRPLSENYRSNSYTVVNRANGC